MTATCRGIVTGLGLGLAFTAGLFAGVTRERLTPPPPMTQTLLPSDFDGPALPAPVAKTPGPTFSVADSARELDRRDAFARADRQRRQRDALELAYRANLAREGLTPRVSHEER